MDPADSPHERIPFLGPLSVISDEPLKLLEVGSEAFRRFVEQGWLGGDVL